MPRPEVKLSEQAVQNIYGIAGWFESRYLDVTDFIGGVFPMRVAFGGYFRKEPITGITGRIEGELVDLHGKAQIIGSLNTNSLTFTKIYHEGESIGVMVEYDYKKGRNRLWKGNYHLISKDGGARGPSECCLTLVCQSPALSPDTIVIRHYTQQPVEFRPQVP